MKLLVADDHDEFRKCLVYFIQSQRGLRVVAEARDGVDAIRKAKRTHPDLVLMNTKMPLLDAWATAKTIKSLCPYAHLVAISLESVPAELPIRREIVMEAFLEKGHIAKELPKVIAMVRAEVRRSRMNPATASYLQA